ncbi:MAG: hypothetical protein IMZ46_14090 [Acidobacteria bacterium]|nr:hypothetical protein [Acidobacteriota bacterium]
MRIKALVLISVISSSFLFAAEQSLDKIPIFVKSGATAGGFTDPSKDRQNSTKDLLNRLKNSRAVRLVESEQDALVVLEVLGRETKRETNLWGRQNKSYLTVRLIAGEYSAEFTGDGGSKGVLTGYGAAAGKVVKQLEEWIRANRDQLLVVKK